MLTYHAVVAISRYVTNQLVSEVVYSMSLDSCWYIWRFLRVYFASL